jgi:hypothetical protein
MILIKKIIIAKFTKKIKNLKKNEIKKNYFI